MSVQGLGLAGRRHRHRSGVALGRVAMQVAPHGPEAYGPGRRLPPQTTRNVDNRSELILPHGGAELGLDDAPLPLWLGVGSGLWAGVGGMASASRSSAARTQLLRRVPPQGWGCVIHRTL